MALNWDLIVFSTPFAALAAALLALILSIAMHVRVGRIFRSATSSDIEKLLKLHSKTLEEYVGFRKQSTDYMKSLDGRIKKKLNGAPTLRFNPFQGEGIGGNQSFSSVLADEEGDGVVITSMHTRDRTSMFAKPLKGWKSEYELSEEEKKAIEKRING